MAYSTKYWHRSAWESLKNSSSSTITISSECNTQWFMLVFHVLNCCNSFSCYHVSLASERKKERKSEDRRFARFSDLPVWYFSDALRLKLTVPLSMEALGNAWYGSWSPLNNLTQTFQACHLCTFNVAAIFFRGHPYIWRTTVRHDIHVAECALHSKKATDAVLLYLAPVL